MTRILLVEDDDHQRLLYREDFEDHGYEVVEARDGAEALQAIDRYSPDAVVLDVNMPTLDGLSALGRIHERHRRLPVILNSAYSAYANQYVSWIADAYVTKSSNLAELRDAVSAAITKARHRA